MAGMIIKKRNDEHVSESDGKRNDVIDEMNDPFARQRLIAWWDQEKIEQAKILVVGAGAIGNEQLHNGALLGFRNMAICDLDRIELSNLSRTVLFRKEDEGKKKAEVAAERTREMCLAQDPRIDWFCGDVMYELGSGVFRHFDLILGCLDNDATRFYIDRQCTMFEKPWINAGISELAVGLQLFYHKETGTCFHCGESPEAVARVMRRKASCGKTAIEELKSGKIPTIQVASAIVAGMQAQEAAKYICGRYVNWGSNYYYQGTNHSFEVSRTRLDEHCLHHWFPIIREVVELERITQSSTMRALMAEAREKLGIDGPIMVDLRDEHGREFIRSTACVYCGEEVAIHTPGYKFRDDMAICEHCRGAGSLGEPSEPITYAIYEYTDETDAEILDMTLGELGIPPVHVLRIYDENDRAYFVEMTGDLPHLMPNIFGKREE